MISQLRTGDLIAVRCPETKLNAPLAEPAIVVDVDDLKRTIHIRPLNQREELALSWDELDIANRIVDIPLTKIWIAKLGFELKEGALYALPTHEYWFERIFEVNGFTIKIQLKIEKGEWVLVIPKSEAYFLCRFEALSSIRSLQNKVKSIYGVELPIDTLLNK